MDSRLPQVLRGFAGQFYNDEVASTGMILLRETVLESQKGDWVARGLVRNDTQDSVGNVIVTAKLLSQEGKLLETVTGIVPVKQVRPGEPAPFVVRSTTDSQTVSAVEWEIMFGPAPANISRDFEPQISHVQEFKTPALPSSSSRLSRTMAGK